MLGCIVEETWVIEDIWEDHVGKLRDVAYNIIPYSEWFYLNDKITF